MGKEFEVSGLRKEKEDAFVAAVTNRVLYAIDNADTRVDWLEDALARYATGEAFRFRRLYTTNEEVSYRPRAILMLTSRDPLFSALMSRNGYSPSTSNRSKNFKMNQRSLPN